MSPCSDDRIASRVTNTAADPREHLAYCDGTQNPKRTDDIDKLLKRLENADGIIFGTPTYWFNMSARMKNLLERFIVTEKGNEYTLEGIVAGFVATGRVTSPRRAAHSTADCIQPTAPHRRQRRPTSARA